jgi:hypothetical protein
MGYTIRALKELQNDPLNINSEKVEFPHTGFNTVYTVYTVYIQFIRRTYMYTKIPYTVLANPTYIHRIYIWFLPTLCTR